MRPYFVDGVLRHGDVSDERNGRDSWHDEVGSIADGSSEL